MIITLKNADFSQSNIGTLSTWRITRSLGSGATYEGPTSVDKDAVLNATVTIAEGYELGSAGVTVTMGGIGQTYTMVGNVITISIAEVIGNVVIKVPTVNINTGEEDEPEVPVLPGIEGVTNGITYRYELGKSIKNATGELLEGDNYKLITLIIIPQIDTTKELVINVLNGYNYNIFYYKGDTYVGKLSPQWISISNIPTTYDPSFSYIFANANITDDFDTIKIIYRKTSITDSTTASAPEDIGFAMYYINEEGYEIGWSINSSGGTLIHDAKTNKYSHITSLKPVAYQDNLKFSINTGYVWAFYCYDANMSYLGTHDGATSSPWETAVSNYDVSQIKSRYSNIAYIVAAYKETNGTAGQTGVAPSVSGAHFHQ